MAITEIYVDPSIDGDSGTGSSGDPYGDLQYALDNEAYDFTNGTRINIKAGTAEVMTALADFSSFNASAWPIAITAPMTFEGYTSTAGDGGFAEIDMNNSTYGFMQESSRDYIGFKNLKLGNQGTTDYVVQLDNNCWFVNCWFHSGGILLACDNNNIVTRCRFTSGDNVGLVTSTTASITNCYFENGDNEFVDAVEISTNADFRDNIINLKGSGNSSNGIRLVGYYARVTGNSIYSNAGSGKGIYGSATRGEFEVSNNLIEGFSDSGGIGVDLANVQYLMKYCGNAVYNCATEYNSTTISNSIYLADNETLSASPFNAAGSDDFSPVDTGNVKGGWEPPDFGDALS